MPDPSEEAELRLLTVVFCDLVGSTALAERVEPERYRTLFQEYYVICDDAIRRQGGHVVKHIGDGVMAYFGYPVASGDDAVSAVLAGLEICARAADTFRAADDTADLDVRVGINTGSAIVGLAGTGLTREALSVGDTVNIAARVEGAAPVGRVAITESTYRLVRDRFDATPLGPRELKGVSEPIQIYAVEGQTTQRRRQRQLQRPAFVGRDREVAQLTAIAGEVRAGAARFVAVVGEPGMGKSRLVDDVQAQLGMRVEVVTCSPAEQYSNLRPIIRLIQQLGDDEEPDPTHQPEAPVDDYTPQARRERLFESTHATLADAASDDALAVVIEDVHWADPSTVEFLGRMATSPTPVPLLVVVTTRPGPEYVPEGFEPLELPPLSDEDSSALITALDTIDPDVAASIVERANGIPLFLEELVRSAAHGSSIDDGVPITLHSLLAAQLDRVGRARQLAQLGALLGSRFRIEDLAELVDDPQELDAGLATLIDADVLHRVDDTTVAFRHALMQEAAPGTMLGSVRRREHARIARTFERRASEGADVAPQVTAYHWTKAGRDDNAYPYFVEAASVAARDFANQEALALYDRALQGLSRLVLDDPDRFVGELSDVQERCGDIHALLHRLDEAEGMYRLAHVSSTDPVRRSQLLTKLALVHQQNESLAMAALDEADRALRAISSDRPDRDEAVLRLRLAQLRVNYWFGHGEAMRQIIDELGELVEVHASPTQKAEFYDQCVLANFRLERYAMSAHTRELGAHYVVAARLSGDTSLLAEARFTNAFILLFGGDHAAAIEELQHALELARRTGNRAIEVRATIYLVTAERLSGIADAAFLERCERALELARAEQMPEYEAVVLANLAWLRRHSGDAVAAIELAETALELWEATGMAWPFRWLALLPRLALAVEAEDERAVRLAVESLLHPSQQRLPAEVARAAEAVGAVLQQPAGPVLPSAAHLVDVARHEGLLRDPSTDVAPVDERESGTHAAM